MTRGAREEKAAVTHLTLRLPRWFRAEVASITTPVPTSQERMDVALHLAERNITEGTGGPFSACVFERDGGRLVAAAVNIVLPSRCSVAHAEVLAIMLAQQALGTHDLAAPGLPAHELVTTAQPCCQCFGALWWSGVGRVVIGASGDDVTSLTGFMEGPLPDNWAARLAQRAPLPPVEVVHGCRRERARALLEDYVQRGGVVYNPGFADAAGRAPS